LNIFFKSGNTNWFANDMFLKKNSKGVNLMKKSLAEFTAVAVAIFMLVGVFALTSCSSNNDSNEEQTQYQNTTLPDAVFPDIDNYEYIHKCVPVTYNSDTNSNDAENYDYLTSLRSELEELQQQLESALKELDEARQALIPPLLEDWWHSLYHHGLSEDDIKRDFIENANDLLSFMGADDVIVDEESIYVTSFYIVADVELVIAYPHRHSERPPIHAQVVLNYYVLRSGIDWRVRMYRHGTGDYWWSDVTTRQPAFAERVEGQPFELDGYFTITFNSFDWDAWYGDSFDEQIYAANWREEFIRLYYYYTGERMRDIWYEGNMIVVDFYSSTRSAFVFAGSSPEGILSRLMFPPLFSLPYVEKVDFLIDGRRVPFTHAALLCPPITLDEYGRMINLCTICSDLDSHW